jgi:hypothetical protein
MLLPFPLQGQSHLDGNLLLTAAECEGHLASDVGFGRAR